MEEPKKKGVFSRLSLFDVVGPRLFAALGLAVITGLTILLSLYDAELNFVGADPKKILYEVGMMDGLYITAMQCAQIFCEDIIKKSADSDWSVAKNSYLKAFGIIAQIRDYFGQYFVWFKARELFDKKMDYIMGKDHFDDIAKVRKLVKYCTLDEVHVLLEHPIKRPISDDDPTEVLLPMLTKDQYADLLYVLQGNVKLVNVQSSQYYLSLNSRNGSLSILEEPSVNDASRVKSMRWSMILAIAAFTLIHAFLAFITIKEWTGDGAEKWINLIKRITALVSGLWMGFMIKTGDLKYAAAGIDLKTEVLEYYSIASENGSFKPFTDEEKQEKSWQLYQAKVELDKKEEEERIRKLRDEEAKRQETKNRYWDYKEGSKITSITPEEANLIAERRKSNGQ